MAVHKTLIIFCGLCIIEQCVTQVSLTLDADQHELVEGQGAVVGDHLSGLDAAQADLAEVLLAGQAGQCCVGQVGVLGH